MKISHLAIILLLMGLLSCKQNATVAASQTEPQTAEIVKKDNSKKAFDADSAYAYVAQQVAFGPRVPGSEASRRFAAWAVGKLQDFGAQDIQQQRGKVTAWDGSELDICNISARFNPSARQRILLLAHYDSRPWADHDPNPSRRNQPIDGANDGASGVGVIMELARQYEALNSPIGLDILLVDAEDYGVNENLTDAVDNQDSWCLGTQFWLKNPTLPIAQIDYAVLLDMVGAQNAVFAREYHSELAASKINDKVWQAARKAGYAAKFPDKIGAAIVDDHVYLLMAGIPAIDIIDATNPDTGTFPSTWHTQEDTIDNISPATLQAVGETLVKLFQQ